MYFLLILVGLVEVGSAMAGSAEKVSLIRAECPLCGEDFKFRFVLQETRSGLRLDFKPFGSIHSPAELPECPECGFTLIDGGRDELSRAEVSLLRDMVRSDRYAMAREETSYFRLAVALEAVGRSPDDIAFAYVAASWQVDESPVRSQVYLARALAWYETYLGRAEGAPPARQRAMLLRAEILRRLARFAEAREYLAELAFHPLMARPNEQNIIQQQLDLVAARDDEPHVAIADDAQVDVYFRVVSQGGRAARPELGETVRLPAYPSGPYAARMGGSVMVQLSLTRGGYVAGWKVRAATAAVFSQAVERSLPEWTFDPSLLDGAPSPLEVECTVLFRLDG